MDLVMLYEHQIVGEGLQLMMASFLRDPLTPTVQKFVSVETALLIVAVAKISADDPDWFPCGKYATIQAIDSRISDELMKHLKGGAL